MTLNAQGLLAVKPGIIVKIRALEGVTAGTGHHLTGTRVKNVYTDGMGKLAV